MKNNRFHSRSVYAAPFLILLLSSILEASDVPDPGRWYAESYAPLWREVTSDSANGVAPFYHSELREHVPTGEILVHESAIWLTESIARWREEGWTGSEVPNLLVNRINASTVSFNARYRDYYDGGETEYSCGWYLADLVDGQWKFTGYAEMDCGSHDWGVGEGQE